MGTNSKSLFGIPLLLLLTGTLCAFEPVSAANITICNQYDTVNITPSSKTYVVQNNVWNDVNGSQCLKVDDATGDFSIISSGHNKSTSGPPAAYPSIFKGCHWGKCTNSTTRGMPKQVSAIFQASSSWSTVQPSLGVYSVSYDIWLNRTPTTSGQPNGAELMIWLNQKGGVQPAGSLIARAVSIAGANWDIWLGTNNGINVISYVRNTGVTSVCNLNLKNFLTDAKTRGYIQPAWYLIAVEAGFQVWQDSVGLTSGAFNILVE